MNHFQKILTYFGFSENPKIMLKIQKFSENLKNPKIIQKIQQIQQFSENEKSLIRKSEKSKINSENPKNKQIQKKKPKSLIRKFEKSSQGQISFYTSDGNSVPFGTIINSSLTNPRFGPSFK